MSTVTVLLLDYRVLPRPRPPCRRRRRGTLSPLTMYHTPRRLGPRRRMDRTLSGEWALSSTAQGAAAPLAAPAGALAAPDRASSIEARRYWGCRMYVRHADHGCTYHTVGDNTKDTTGPLQDATGPPGPILYLHVGMIFPYRREEGAKAGACTKRCIIPGMYVYTTGFPKNFHGTPGPILYLQVDLIFP